MATSKSPKPAAKKPAAAKVMDVAKPGKTPAAATSRPAIVGHKPIMKQDPMISGDKAASENTDADSTRIAVTRTAKVVAPLNLKADAKEEEAPAEAPIAPVAAEEPATEETPADTPEPAEEPAEPVAEEAPAEDTEAPAETEETPESKPDETGKTPEEAGVVDAVAEQAGSKKKENQESEEEKQKRENLEKLISDKKYFVKTGQVTHRKHTQWAFIVLLLIMVALVAVVALDAGWVDIGVDLPFDYL